MLRLGILSTLSAVALAASCGGTVDLENRPCPCSAEWTCCTYSLLCVEHADQCPAAPRSFCKPPWQPSSASCVLDVDVRDEDVCTNGETPVLQVDLDGNRDACRPGDPTKPHRPFECTTHYKGSNVEGMVVDYGAQVVLQGPDRCRLHAPLLTSEPLP